MVKRLQTCWVVAAETAASRAFYEDLIGLEPAFADGERWVQYRVGGTSFAIGAPGEHALGAAAVGGGAVPVFEVEGLDAQLLKLEAAGADVLSLRDMGPHGRVLSLRDPAGNVVQLFERAP